VPPALVPPEEAPPTVALPAVFPLVPAEASEPPELLVPAVATPPEPPACVPAMAVTVASSSSPQALSALANNNDGTANQRSTSRGSMVSLVRHSAAAVNTLNSLAPVPKRHKHDG
jgi:hypothetical protein